MSYNFSPDKSAAPANSNLIPSGSLTWALVTVREFKSSQSSGGEFADLELVCYQGLWEGRKIFVNVLDPRDDRHSEAGRNMGFGALLHLVEAAGLVKVSEPESYAYLNTRQFREIMMELDGKVVGIQVSVKKDASGAYPDKNQVGEYLTPNPARGRPNKGWVALCEGKTSLKPTTPAGPATGIGAASQGGFGQAGQTPANPAAPGGFAAPRPVTPAPAPTGFGAVQQAMTAATAQPPQAQPNGAAKFDQAPAWLANNQPAPVQGASPAEQPAQSQTVLSEVQPAQQPETNPVAGASPTAQPDNGADGVPF